VVELVEKYLFEKLDKLQQVRDLMVTMPGCTSGVSSIINSVVSEMGYTRKEIIRSLAEDRLNGMDVKADATIYCTLTGIAGQDVVRGIKWQEHLLTKKLSEKV
jgi:hypothetical protein